MVEILGDHPNISMAKDLSSDPGFGVGQDLDQVFEAAHIGSLRVSTSPSPPDNNHAPQPQNSGH